MNLFQVPYFVKVISYSGGIMLNTRALCKYMNIFHIFIKETNELSKIVGSLYYSTLFFKFFLVKNRVEFDYF